MQSEAIPTLIRCVSNYSKADTKPNEAIADEKFILPDLWNSIHNDLAAVVSNRPLFPRILSCGGRRRATG